MVSSKVIFERKKTKNEKKSSQMGKLPSHKFNTTHVQPIERSVRTTAFMIMSTFIMSFKVNCPGTFSMECGSGGGRRLRKFTCSTSHTVSVLYNNGHLPGLVGVVCVRGGRARQNSENSKSARLIILNDPRRVLHKFVVANHVYGAVRVVC